ncbi:MAG TPA: urease accessory protein UreD [Candidatus Didemnitutus sp.]|nr:urease accessory protein UreD [Candidatus Didemnitutus sp.]
MVAAPPKSCATQGSASLTGHISLQAEANEGRTFLARQSFQVPYHLSKPYWDVDTGTLVAQVVNPTAGVLAGDRLRSEISVGPGAALLVTTPSANRVFRMKRGEARSEQILTVAKGGWLEILPEPLVPHRECSYRQSVRIDVAGGGALFFADLLLPGRIAHGERWAWNHLCLETDIRFDGQRALHERFSHRGGELGELAALSGSGHDACFGNAVLIGTPEPAALDALRELDQPQCRVGVSPLRLGGWSIKFVARDSLHLREALQAIRRILAPQFPHLGCDARKL